MISRCDLEAEDLIGYLDGDLLADRRQAVEAAVQSCPACAHELAALRNVGVLLRVATPLVDDPVGRATVRARVEDAARRRHLPWQVPSARLALPLALLLLALVAWPVVHRDGARVRDAVRATAGQIERALPDIGDGERPSPPRWPSSGSSRMTVSAALPPMLRETAHLFPNPAPSRAVHWNSAQVAANRSARTRTALAKPIVRVHATRP